MKQLQLAAAIAAGTFLVGCSGTAGGPLTTMTLGSTAATYNLACGCPVEPPVEAGDVTGGGWVTLSCGCPGTKSKKITFGLVAHHNPAKGPSGNIEVNDHETGINYHGRVDAISRSGNTVTFTGSLDGGGTFTCVVTDNGEPGKDDRFGFRTNTTVVVPVGTVLGGGNIQLHPTH